MSREYVDVETAALQRLAALLVKEGEGGVRTSRGTRGTRGGAGW